jgi:exonuclease III
LKTVARELGKYKLDLVGVQEVRWEKGDTERAEDYTFSFGKGNEDHRLGTGFIVHKRIISAVRRVEFVSDRMSYTTLRVRWCNIVVLNVHAPCEGKSYVYDLKNSFYEEIGSVFDQFSRYDMIFFGGEFNTNVGREDIFKPTIWNEISQEIIYDNGVRVVNFAIYKILAPCSPIAAFINTHGSLLMDRCTTRLIKF